MCPWRVGRNGRRLQGNGDNGRPGVVTEVTPTSTGRSPTSCGTVDREDLPHPLFSTRWVNLPSHKVGGLLSVGFPTLSSPKFSHGSTRTSPLALTSYSLFNVPSICSPSTFPTPHARLVSVTPRRLPRCPLPARSSSLQSYSREPSQVTCTLPVETSVTSRRRGRAGGGPTRRHERPCSRRRRGRQRGPFPPSVYFRSGPKGRVGKGECKSEDGRDKVGVGVE